jgi:multidrug efflux pump subunit AcrB
VRAEAGTAIDGTLGDLKKVIAIIQETVGAGALGTTLGYVGTQPTQYALNNIFLWTSGPQEAVLQVTLGDGARLEGDALKEELRARFKRELPGVEVTFEAAGLVDQVMSAGSPTPIEIAVHGRDLVSDREVAKKVRDALVSIPGLRDVTFGQPYDYPAVSINVDRAAAGRRGVGITDVGKSVVPVTSSTRFVLPNFWEDRDSGVNYQVQVQVPQGEVHSVEQLKEVPVTVNGGSLPLKDFAQVTLTTQVAEYDRYNMQRMATVTGNLQGIDLGHASERVERALAPVRAGLPRGTQLKVRGQMKTLSDMSSGLVRGLAFSVVVILLLLASSF